MNSLNPESLRIGSVIGYNEQAPRSLGKKGLRKVTRSIIVKISLHRPSYYFGVPLSELIMFDMGFILDTAFTNGISYYLNGDNVNGIRYIRNIETNKVNFYFGEFNNVSKMVKVKTPNCIHELQNLYFGLFNEAMEYNGRMDWPYPFINSSPTAPEEQ